MSQYRARPPATLLLDDAVVRITRWDVEPGADTGVHTHGMGYVVVPMTDCQYLLEERSDSRRVEVTKSAAYRRDADTEHNVVSAGDQPMSFLEIEYK
ncbi:quercetin dioxygenase-like cupin family protein [Rhizobium mesoamericanum]|uniref:cupin n=1 Tax=Rhizobium mesoamericanum TaxID=1079800 RepID=UPI0027830EB1|nr:cupin [Rhizobium mesoamericanum]MDQ0559447.1 quercetin dioxygenase-like cupin family protein [Rhizobium mesoamericanum]